MTISGDTAGVIHSHAGAGQHQATGTEVIAAPAVDEAVTETVSVDVGGGQTARRLRR